MRILSEGRWFERAAHLLPFAPRRGRRIEIGRLFGHPPQKPHDFGMIDQLFAVTGTAREFGIGEHRLDCAATDRMHSDGRAATPAFGYGMIAINLLAQRTQAQPALWWRAGCFVRLVIEVKRGPLFAPIMFRH